MKMSADEMTKKSTVNHPVNKSRDPDSWVHSSIPAILSGLSIFIKMKKNEP